MSIINHSNTNSNSNNVNNMQFELTQTCDIKCSSKEYLETFLYYESMFYNNSSRNGNNSDSNEDVNVDINVDVTPPEGLYLLNKNNTHNVHNSNSNSHR